MKAQRYNGWKNYETWNVALWLRNDEGLYNQARDLARSIKGRITGADAERIVIDEIGLTKTPDMDRASQMNRVSWPEIARDLMEMR